MSDTIEPTEAEASVLAELFSTTRRQSNLAILRAYRDSELTAAQAEIAELRKVIHENIATIKTLAEQVGEASVNQRPNESNSPTK